MNLRLIPKAKPKVRLAPKPPQSKMWNAADDVFLDANKQRQAVKASFGKGLSTALRFKIKPKTPQRIPGLDRPKLDKPNLEKPNLDKPNLDKPNLSKGMTDGDIAVEMAWQKKNHWKKAGGLINVRKPKRLIKPLTADERAQARASLTKPEGQNFPL